MGYGGYGGYAAPVAAYSAAPAVSYSYASAPLAKVAAPVAAYAAPALASYHAPAVASYHAPALASYHAPALASYHAPALASYHAPIAKTIIAEPVAPAAYDFGYSVSDPHTGDSKSQQESRRGDQVQGSYSLIEADGSKRIVEYVADDHNGFNAVVHREPAAVAVKAVAPAYGIAKVAAPVLSYAASPVVAKYGAPALYH